MAITTTVYTAKLAPARTLRVRGPVTLCFSSICFMPSEDNLATLISISVTRRGFRPFAETHKMPDEGCHSRYPEADEVRALTSTVVSRNHPGGLRCRVSSL